MANATYLVQHNSRGTVKGGNAMVVWAGSANQAKEIAESKFDGDGGIWAGATATLLADAGTLAGWLFEIIVQYSTPKVIQYTAVGANIAAIGPALASYINAAGVGISTASYAANVLTVVSAAGNLGDKTLVVNVYPPGSASPIPSMLGTIVHQGVAAAALTVGLPAAMDTPPYVSTVLKQV
jgi:hypothetical protein